MNIIFPFLSRTVKRFGGKTIHQETVSSRLLEVASNHLSFRSHGSKTGASLGFGCGCVFSTSMDVSRKT